MRNRRNERAERTTLLLQKKLQFKKIIIIVIYKTENIDVAIKVRETILQSM